MSCRNLFETALGLRTALCTHLHLLHKHFGDLILIDLLLGGFWQHVCSVCYTPIWMKRIPLRATTPNCTSHIPSCSKFEILKILNFTYNSISTFGSLVNSHFSVKECFPRIEVIVDNGIGILSGELSKSFANSSPFNKFIFETAAN